MLTLESTKRVFEYWRDNFARIYIEIYDDEPDECIFTHLWVDEDFRQMGYGGQVLSEAEEKARELGCEVAYLKVETNSWMRAWYMRCGYRWYNDTNDDYTWLVKKLVGDIRI
jgi:GNAT superfamily N-acetyltransferase